ncbi:hypothetical protein Fot_32084 [Forsythia ovata]|uniref:Uncharacterized protein n=1 Tax=Forsythia ovata TaxID=205694 RepID=A0ABD1T6T1_9LAMI
MSEEDVEVLEDDALRRANKPMTHSSKSSHLGEKLGMFPESSSGLALQEEAEFIVSLEFGHIKKVLEERPVDISLDLLNMLLDPTSKVTVVVDSYWTEEWVTYSDQSSPSLKLSAPKAMAA